MIRYTALLMLGFASQTLQADPLMTKAQYENYAVSYQCAESKFRNDLQKQESAFIKIEEKYGLNDDNFDAFDELVSEYEQDAKLLDNIRQRVKKECT